MATFISTLKFERFWRKAQGWFATQFASINFKPVEDKIDEVKDAVDNIDFSAIAKQGSNANATLSAVLEALQGSGTPSQDIPEGVAERLAMILEHFGIKTISGYEFMQDTEVCDELEDIMQVIDPNLTAEQAAAITAQTLNPSES